MAGVWGERHLVTSVPGVQPRSTRRSLLGRPNSPLPGLGAPARADRTPSPELPWA